MRHEGLAPVRLAQARNRIGLFQADVSMPDIGSVALSFPWSSVLVPELTTGNPWTPGSPFRAHEAPRPAGRTEMAPSVHDLKNGASPSLAQETGEARSEGE
jgi:hypothetical protein